MPSSAWLLLPLIPVLAACGSTGTGVTGTSTGTTSTSASGPTATSTAPFSCGTTTCAGSDYCEAYSPGTAPPGGGGPGYTCNPIPAGCDKSPTCACIQAALPQSGGCGSQYGGTCSDDGEGHVTLDCKGF